MQHPGHELPFLPVVQRVADPDLDRVRGEDAENTGELQREQVHRLHHVHNLHHMAGVRPDILWYRERARDTDHHSLRCHQPERDRHTRLPLFPQDNIILFQPDKNIRRKVTMGDKSKKQGSSAGTSSITKCEFR